MSGINRRLIPEGFQQRFIKLLNPLIKLFTAWGLNPNSLSLAGVIITSFASILLIMGFLRFGGLFILLGGLCDTLDGTLARSINKASRFGALFDSSADRYSEFIMFFGLAAHFVSSKDYGTSMAIYFALCGSIMVSYARARAESLGFDAKIGFLHRPERIVLIGTGALIHPVALIIAVWLVAIFANLTALQRIRHAYKQEISNLK